jgi:hypothetical protein
MNPKKLKQLSKKLNLPDAKLLVRALTDCYNTVMWTPEQKERIRKIKEKMEGVKC